VDALCFGSESGELAELQQAADTLLQNRQEILLQTAKLLREGLNYPQARARLLERLLPNGPGSEVVSAPNNILGVEYLKALRQTASSIEPLTIQRIGAGYHDTEISAQNIASATGIRQLLASGEKVDELVPKAALQPLADALAQGRCYSAETYVNLLLGQILRDPQGLQQYWLIDDGIENRLLAVAEQAETLEALVAGVKTRQLTRTRIQRLLVALLLAVKKEEAKEQLDAGPSYLHLLGVSKNGERFVAATRKLRAVPLVQNFSRVNIQLKRFYGAGSEGSQRAYRQLELELRATRLYSLLLHNWPGGKRNRDFFEPLRKGAV
jgi:predicted nucleotidyltransferase